MKKRFITACSIITLLMHALEAGAELNLLAHWRFDDGAGRLISDNSNNDNKGSIEDIKWVQGVHNGCIQLSYQAGANCGNDVSLNTDVELTIQAWIKPLQLRFEESPNIVCKEGSYALGLGPDRSLTLTLWLNGEKQTFNSNYTNWPDGKWQHVTATYDGSVVNLYINGGLDRQIDVTPGQKISSSASDCFIGSVDKKNSFTGSIDELQIYGKAITSQDIALTCKEGEEQIACRENRFIAFHQKGEKRKARAIVQGTLWIDAEDFDDYGGWWMDTQFVPEMGSPYLIAAGIGKPVSNAATIIEIPKSGTYRLWVRNKNWLREYSPGKFLVSVGGKKSARTFGTAANGEWIWQDGGKFELVKGEISIVLEDLTGYYGRCDALILTTNLDYTPPQAQEEYRAERNRFVGTLPEIDEGHYDVIVVGGGVAGCIAAIASARKGARTALIQDRPMLGGNNSQEMGVPISGGSSSNKGREPGMLEEIGRESAFLFLTKWSAAAEQIAFAEPNLTVFLNTRIFDAETGRDKRIEVIRGFNMIDDHRTRYSADQFIDCTGDGWLGYYAGAEYMYGRESKETFGESLAPDVADNITMSGSLFHHSILGYRAVDMGKPTPYDAPEWVYDLRAAGSSIELNPGYDRSYLGGNWWHENRGEIDDLWDPEFARDDLIRVSLSYYSWIKNYSSLAEKARNYQLKSVPITNAKRETRRLVGDHILVEDEVMKAELFPDRVGYITWSVDVHHPDGIFSTEGPFDYFFGDRRKHPYAGVPHHPVASIPYRILYSKNIPNLLFAGRNVSVSHVALGTVRVQGTTGQMGQVVGTAAAMCVKYGTDPRGIYETNIGELQQTLLKDDMYILELKNEDPNDLALNSEVSASSSFSEQYVPANVINGVTRMDKYVYPERTEGQTNMWMSDPDESMPQWIQLDLSTEKKFNSVRLTFDTNPVTKRHTTRQYTDSDRFPPECVRDYRVLYHNGTEWIPVVEVRNNYQRQRVHRFPAVLGSKLKVVIDSTNSDESARIFEIRVYNN